MPRFTEEDVNAHLDDFIGSLSHEQQCPRIAFGLYFALTSDQFRTEIANPMEDVRLLIDQAEDFIEDRLWKSLEEGNFGE
ncbi:hypothetical protein TH61_00575 [Rufibacter sp. DG15C]|nr:hypothetical protein TH61_00575 [Rufibacter sp. DG15C]